MAKTMAFIENGVITNILWCSDSAKETDTLKDPKERSVGIGDTYEDGKFYRDGVEILTPLEELQKENEALKAKNTDMQSALEYLGVTE